MAGSYTLHQEHLNEWVTRQHGLPSHQIHDVLFCNRNLWLATPNGLAIFDGENMHVLDQRQGLLTNGLRRLAIDGDYILVSSDNGLDRINSHDLTLVDQYSSVENGLGWCQAAAALMHNSSNKTAMDKANQIIKQVSQLKIEHQLSDCAKYVTISVGVATNIPVYEVAMESSAKFQKKIIGEADKALYNAKSKGRNQACIYQA